MIEEKTPTENDAIRQPQSSVSSSTATSPPPRSTLRSIALGQLLSILIAGTGIFSNQLSNGGVSVPTTQSALSYALLSLYLLRLRRLPRPHQPPPSSFPHLRYMPVLRIPWWKYLLLAIVDVEANFVVVMAYRYTSITSIMLLDCFAIPSAMFLSWGFLRSRYKPLHLIGVFLCLGGLGCTVLSDYIETEKVATGKGRDNYPYAIKGDLLCLLGAFLYASSNVMQEIIVKSYDPIELLAMIGGMGVIVSLIQASILEFPYIASLDWDESSLVFLCGFALTLACMYSLTAFFLTEADATLFNLSLLTSDVYAVIYRYVALQQAVSWLYGVAFFFTLSGLWIYHLPPPVNLPKSIKIGENDHDEGEGRGEGRIEGDASPISNEDTMLKRKETEVIRGAGAATGGSRDSEYQPLRSVDEG